MATITRYTAGLQNQTTGLPMLSQAATILDSSLVAATLYTDETGGTVLSLTGATSSTPQGNLIFFADADLSDDYVIRVPGQVDVPVPLPPKSSAVVRVKAVNRPRLLDSFAGVDPTGASDCGAAITTAVASFKGSIDWHPQGLYKTTTTILLGSNSTHRGAWGGIIPSSGILHNGSQILWAGASGGTVLKALDCENTIIDGIGIDGGGIANVTGLFIDSDNTPASYMVDVAHFYIQRCGTGTGTGVGIRVCKDIINSYQADKIQIHDGTIYAGDIGLSIESDNACDGSVIKGISFAALNTHLQVLACGEMCFDGLIFGGLLGNDPAYISLGQRGSGTQRYNPLVFRSCQGEMGGSTIAAGSNGAALPQATINVASTAAVAATGNTILVETSTGLQLVTFTGSTGTTYTGCTGGTGTMSTGAGVYPGYMLRVFGTPDTAQPLNLQSNVFGGPVDVTIQRRVLTEGNFFGTHFWMSGSQTLVYPRGDTFAAGKTFQPIGAASKVGSPLWVSGENGQGAACVVSAVRSGAPTICGNIGDLCVRLDTGALYRCTVAGLTGAATWTTP